MNKEWYPGIDYQELFDYLYSNHNLILVQSEMDEIIYIVKKFLQNERDKI